WLGNSMSDFWSKSIKIVGLPGLVLYIFYCLIDKIFDEKLTHLLGIERVFVLIIIILILLTVFFLYSTFKTTKPFDNGEKDHAQPKNKSVEDDESERLSPTSIKNQTVVYRDNAKHKGDNNFS
ncbi:TPA: hypothetical protein ACQJXY_003370, partial [Citrobacter freundii]